MALARHNLTAQDSEGDLLPSIQVEVRRQSDLGLAQLYEDREGDSPLGNPATLAQTGAGCGFFVESGSYRLTITTSEGSVDVPYVAIGTSSEFDDRDFARTQDLEDEEEPYNAAQVTAGEALVGADFDGLPRPGLFGIEPSSTNRPGDDDNYQVINMGDEDHGAQIAVNAESNEAWVRTVEDGVWSAWDRLFTTEDKATTIAHVAAATANKLIDGAAIATASAAAGVLADAATVTVDWATFIYDTLTITANRALGNPSNEQVGTTRMILVQGNDGTPRTLTFGSEYDNSDAPTLTDITSTKKYLLGIICVASGSFVVKTLAVIG